MGRLEFRGDRNVTKRMPNHKRAKLTDEDLEYSEDKHAELLGRIERVPGETRAATQKTIREVNPKR
jgi:hypothetical protein